MGCRFEIAIGGIPGPDVRAAGEEAIAEIETLHAQFTRFERGSLVSRLNEGGHERVDAETFALFELCDEVCVASDGAFDINARGSGRVVLDRSEYHVGVDGTPAVDLGAVAKGYALGRAVLVLREAGVKWAFLHGGGSSTATIGTRPDGYPWRVTIGVSTAAEPVTIELVDQSLSVSGDESQAGHIVDPREGGSACPAGLFAACVGPADPLGAAACDAWATALAVLRRRPTDMPDGLSCFLVEDGRWTISAATC